MERRRRSLANLDLTTRSRVRTRLTVGITPSIAHCDPSSGAGKMWVRTLDGLSKLGVRLQAPRSRRIVRAHPDVWLTNGHLGPLDVGEPVVAHLHEAPWREPDNNHFLDPGFLEASLTQSDAAAEQAAAIITPSEFSRLQVIEAHGVPPERVHAVPHGVDPTVFSPSRREDGQQLVIQRGGRLPYVAFVSVVHPRKNLIALKQAMASLADLGLPHGLVLVASPAADRADSTELFALAGQDLPGHPGRVTMMRGLSELEVAGVMAGAAALCQPSWSEGFGFAALEAMATGTPVVVSNRGALPEVVGDAGVVVEPDALSIEKGLRRVLADEGTAAQLSRAGLERSGRLSWEESAIGWLRVLEEAAG